MKTWQKWTLLGSVTLALIGCGSDTVTEVVVRQPQLREYLVIPNNANNTVTVRGIGLTNGATANLGTASTGAGPIAVKTHPSRNLFFVANNGANSISGFIMDGNGGLTAVPGSPFTGPNLPQALAIHPSGNFLYVAGSAEIRGYAIQPDGSLVAIPASTLALTSPSRLRAVFSNNGAFLHLAETGGVETFAVQASGALTASSNINYSGGGLGNDLLQHPNGTLLLAAVSIPGANNDQVQPFTVDGAGALTAQPVQNLGFDTLVGDAARNGQIYLGVNNGLENRVAGFGVDGASGALTAMPGSPFATSGGGWVPKLDPSNSLLYTGTNLGNSMAGSVRLADGSLQNAAQTPILDSLAGVGIFDFFQFVEN